MIRAIGDEALFKSQIGGRYLSHLFRAHRGPELIEIRDRNWKGFQVFKYKIQCSDQCEFWVAPWELHSHEGTGLTLTACTTPAEPSGLAATAD
jgi:hypothetical protein